MTINPEPYVPTPAPGHITLATKLEFPLVLTAGGQYALHGTTEEVVAAIRRPYTIKRPRVAMRAHTTPAISRTLCRRIERGDFTVFTALPADYFAIGRRFVPAPF